MSTPLEKSAEIAAQNIQLLSDVFAAPITNILQKMAEDYVMSGGKKFDDSKVLPAIEQAVAAVWQRSMYLGVIDAERDLNNKGITSTVPKKLNYSKSGLLSNSVNLIEFAKDPQVARIERQIKDLEKYMLESIKLKDEAGFLSNQRRLDLARIELDIVKNPDPSKRKVAKQLGEVVKAENKLDKAKTSGASPAEIQKLTQEINQLRNPKKAPATKNLKSTGAKARLNAKAQSTLDTDNQPEKGVFRERTFLERIRSARSANLRAGAGSTGISTKQLLSFKPDPTKNTWVDLTAAGSGNPERAAIDRLMATNNVQAFATLNERYPALGGQSIFAREYLENRNATTARTLNKQSQEAVKREIAKYIDKQDPTSKNVKTTEETALRNIREVYLSDKKNSYNPLITQLRDLNKQAEIGPSGYLKQIDKRLKDLGVENPDAMSVSDPGMTEAQRKARLKQINRRLIHLDKKDLALDDLINSGKNVPKGTQATYDAVLKEIDDLTTEQSTLSGAKVSTAETGKGPIAKLLQKRRAVKGEIAEKVNKTYINPDARMTLTEAQKIQISKLAYDSPIKKFFRERDSFSHKEIAGYITDLKRKGGRFDEALYQVASRTASTEVAAAYNIGRLETYLQKGVKYVQFIALMDSRTSVFCTSLSRKIFSLPDLLGGAVGQATFPDTSKPEWDSYNESYKSSFGINVWMPPCHPYAYLPNTRVASTGIELLMRKRYIGKSVTIKTQEGNHLSVTVEHPILTDRGFIRAGELKGGEYIFDTFDSQGTIISNPDYQASIPTVENLFKLSSVSKSLISGIVPVPTKDLDSKIPNNEVDVIGGTGNLLQDISVAKRRQDSIEILFQKADMGLAPESVDGIFNTIFFSPLALSPGSISRSYHLPSLFGSLPCVEDLLGTEAITDSLTTLSKNAFNNTFLYSKSVTNLFETHSTPVGFYNNLGEFSRELPDTTLFEEMFIKKTQIVDITIEDYDGFVYHVQDSSGINVANGIVAHNCRSYLSPIYTDDNPSLVEVPQSQVDQRLLADFIDKRGLFEGLTQAQREKVFYDIVRSQEANRQSKLSRLVGIVGNLQSSFELGLNFLTRRLRTEGIADFTVADIQKDDSALVKALVAGSAVLGTAAMTYFFLKSNLAVTIGEYVRTKAGLLPSVGALTAPAVKNILTNLATSTNKLKALPPSVIELMGKEANLDAIAVGGRIDDISDLGPLAFEAVALGGDKETLNQLVSANVKGINSIARDNTINQAMINAMQSERLRLKQATNNILSNVFTNAGGVIDPSSITQITPMANGKTMLVGRAGKSPTFVSTKGIVAANNSPAIKAEMRRIQERLKVLDDGLEGVDNLVSEPNQKGLLEIERMEQRQLQVILNAVNNNVLTGKVNLPKAGAKAAESLKSIDELVPQTMEKLISSQTSYRELADQLLSQLDDLLPSDRALRGIVPESFDKLEDLQEVQKLVKTGLANARKDFTNKNKSYTLPTAARKRGLTDVQLRVALEIENNSKLLTSLGFEHENLIGETNVFFRKEVDSRMERVIDLEKRIANRIKELTK